MPNMGIREYSRHRGVSHVAVINAIKSGRLSAAITRNEKGKAVIDSEKADAEWIPSEKEIFKNHPAARPPELERLVPDEPEQDTPANAAPEEKPIAKSFAQARAVREQYSARTAKLEYEQMAGKLVSTEEVERRWTSIVSLVRTKMLGVPSKFKQKYPDISADQYDSLDEIVREGLEEIADSEPSQG